MRGDPTAAATDDSTTSGVAVRLIDEGLRMADHPCVVFHHSAAHGRVAALRSGPDIAEVLNVLTGLSSRGEERVAEVAARFGIHATQVRAAIGYYTSFGDEVDTQIASKLREAEALRQRHESEQALLG